MEFFDSFGQTTVLRFTSFERNPKLEASQFRFSPPKGADVLGDVQ
jgi:outer membrane lipoprotein carrier protein